MSVTGSYWLGFSCASVSHIQNAILTFPTSKLILNKGSCSLLILKELQQGRMTSQEQLVKVPLTCAFKVALDKAFKNMPQEYL